LLSPVAHTPEDAEVDELQDKPDHRHDEHDDQHDTLFPGFERLSQTQHAERGEPKRDQDEDHARGV